MRDILFAFICVMRYIAQQKRKHMKKFLTFAGVVALLILVDQVSKDALLYLITGGVPTHGAAWKIVPVPYLMAHVTNFFNIVFTWNPGASFSMFRTLGEIAPVAIIAVTAAIIGVLGNYAICRAHSWERWPLVLIIGGALGNLIDRIRFGAVIDFLDFHIGAHHWPAFNFADICICAGVGLYIIMWLLARRHHK